MNEKMEKDLSIINELGVKGREIKDTLEAKRALFTEKHCPVKIGDEVEANDTSFYGKTIVVDRISLEKHWGGSVIFAMRGLVKKKDNSIGVKRAMSFITLENTKSTIISIEKAPFYFEN